MIFITGASGFVGKRLVEVLKDRQVPLRVLSRHPQLGLETVVCDLQFERIPNSALEGVDTVFHLAGFAHDLRDASAIEHVYEKVNLGASMQLALLAAEASVKRFIYVSSVKAGGKALAGRRMTELDQGEPEGVYGRTKRAAELSVLEIGRKSKMHVSIIRPPLVYGVGVKGNLRSMITGIRSRWFPPIPETRNCRSMIHVDDLIDAILLVAGDERGNGEIFIATDGVDYSTRGIYDAIRGALGRKSLPVSIPRGLFSAAAWLGDWTGAWLPFDSDKLQKLLGDECYDIDKLKKLGFKPRRTLQEALHGMIVTLENENKEG